MAVIMCISIFINGSAGRFSDIMQKGCPAKAGTAAFRLFHNIECVFPDITVMGFALGHTVLHEHFSKMRNHILNNSRIPHHLQDPRQLFTVIGCKQGVQFHFPAFPRNIQYKVMLLPDCFQCFFLD